MKDEYEQIELSCEYAKNGRVDLLKTIDPKSLIYRSVYGSGYRDGAPIHMAAEHGQLEVVTYLVKMRKSCINHLSHAGTPLQVAVQYEHFNIVKFLLANGASIAATNLVGSSVLDTAILTCNLSIVEYLLFKGAPFLDFKFHNVSHRIDSPSYIDFALSKNCHTLALLLVLLGYDVTKVKRLDDSYVSKLILKIKLLEFSEQQIILNEIKENIKTFMQRATTTSLLCVKHSSVSSLSFYKNKYLRKENIDMYTSYAKMLESISPNVLKQCVEHALKEKNQINHPILTESAIF